MALEFGFGVVQWLAADAAGTNYVVSSLSFEPKAIRFYWVGSALLTDGTSSTNHLRRGVGFATSTSDRRCVGSFSEDNVGNAVCGVGYRTDAIAVLLDGTTTPTAMLDITAISSSGFTLTVDDQSPVDIIIAWEAWGGSDITNAATGEIAEPAATGDVDYTVTGSFQPNVVLFAGCKVTGSAPSAEAIDSGFCVGFASSGSSANNVLVSGNSDDGSATMETDGYALDGECLAQITEGGGNPNARATMTQFNSDGFRLNWIARATTGRKNIYLAIKGGRWQVGTVTIGNSIGNTVKITTPFQPKGLSLITAAKTEDSAGTSSSVDRVGFGTGTSPSARHTFTVQDADTPTVSEIITQGEYDQVLCTAALSTNVIDISSVDSDGITLIRDGTGSMGWMGYLTFGDNAVGRIPRGTSIGHPFIV